MKRRSIARLKRLVRLTEYLYEKEARAAGELIRARDDAAKAAAVTRAYLDHENLVGTVFPELVSARAVKLERRAGELGAEVEHQIEQVAAARGRLTGLSNKLGREIADETQAQEARQLEDAIDQFVRRRLASLK
ncbi:MAG: hypothetical protein ACK4TL_06270 [Hyphomicrobiaceae bacterium]